MNVDVATLRELLRYEPETGKLYWLTRPEGLMADGYASRWNTRFAEKEAFTSPNTSGYLRGTLFNTGYLLHRVAWALHYGEWPSDQIDHIDGDVRNNCIENLRVVTAQQNRSNCKLPTNNTSGVIGVSPSRGSKWRAQIRFHGKQTCLGDFVNFDDAVAARKAAELELGYHPNHGRVAATLSPRDPLPDARATGAAQGTA
jgi:hypothetical protein